MIIRKISLENFRQFYGTQELDFSTSTEKNVTLIHAENGFGKTTLLNAVLWTFFHQTTTKFEKPDEIVNYEAVRERTKYAKVSVEFQHESKLYEATRIHDDESVGSNKTKFTISSISEKWPLQ
ncbi:MAG: AAA family ATPase [Acidobacteria bacterium]|nr:AAA family ATPase [Acidobacteriota bacterium]